MRDQMKTSAATVQAVRGTRGFTFDFAAEERGVATTSPEPTPSEFLCASAHRACPVSVPDVAYSSRLRGTLRPSLIGNIPLDPSCQYRVLDVSRIEGVAPEGGILHVYLHQNLNRASRSMA